MNLTVRKAIFAMKTLNGPKEKFQLIKKIKTNTHEMNWNTFCVSFLSNCLFLKINTFKWV